MGGLTQDIRYALRAARRAPMFSAIAIGCLAVAIAVNAAAFSVLDALLVRDLPGVAHQKELNSVLLSYETRFGRTSPAPVSTLDWLAFRDRMTTFSSSGVMGTASVALRLTEGPLAVRADFVSGDFFAMLGTRPVAGRLLTDDDDVPGALPAAVISYDLWLNEFGGREDAIGRPLYVGDVAFTTCASCCSRSRSRSSLRSHSDSCPRGAQRGWTSRSRSRRVARQGGIGDRGYAVHSS
jgi:hypothetical protein